MSKPAQIQSSLALSCAELAREIVQGPAFFDSKGQVTDAVVRYTGGRTTRDPERVAFVGALKLLNYSDRQIAALAKCDVRSISVMVEDLERTGRIPALKERLIGIVGRNAEQTGILVDQLVSEALAGDRTLELSAMLKAAGQVADKLVEKNQLLTGAATERIETVNAAATEEREAWFRANAIPIEAAVDSESSGTVEITEESKGFLVGDAVKDANQERETKDKIDEKGRVGVEFCSGMAGDTMGQQS